MTKDDYLLHYGEDPEAHKKSLENEGSFMVVDGSGKKHFFKTTEELNLFRTSMKKANNINNKKQKNNV